MSVAIGPIINMHYSAEVFRLVPVYNAAGRGLKKSSYITYGPVEILSCFYTVSM